MSDCRLGAPEGRLEQAGGDGAAAFVMGTGDDVIAEIVASASFTREFLDTWRMPEERFGHSWEERFALTQAYVPLLGKAIQSVLEKAGVAPAALARVILDSPNPRAADEIVRGMKLDPAKVADTLALTVGQTGAAHAGLMLTAVLPSLKPGDLVLMAAVGRRRRRDRLARHAGGGELSPGAFGRPHDRIERRRELRQLPEVAGNPADRAAAAARSGASGGAADDALGEVEVRANRIAMHRVRHAAASAATGMCQMPGAR